MLVIPCWIYAPQLDKAEKKDLELPRSLYKWDTFLSDKYIYTYRQFNPANLVVTEIFRFTGGLLAMTKVIGIIDLSGSHIPFFVRAEAVDAIKMRIDDEKQYRVV